MTSGARNLAIAIALAAAAVAGPVVLSVRDVEPPERTPKPVVLHPRGAQGIVRKPHADAPPPETAGELRHFDIPFYVIRDTGTDLVLVRKHTSLASTGTPGQWRMARTALSSMQRFGSQDNEYSPVPQGGAILGVHVLNGLAAVNLSESFQRNFNGGAREEQMTIYAIVNTVAGTPGIDGVVFEIDGRRITEFAGHLDLSEPLTPDYSLVESAS